MSSSGSDSPELSHDGAHYRRRYGGRDGYGAVRGVSFDVRPGELFALLGTKGAGKTSTLEIVEGLAKPTDGRVLLAGAIVPVAVPAGALLTSRASAAMLGAAWQMARVQQVRRIADESLRDVREVVRGYRRTEVAGEVAGAQAICGRPGSSAPSPATRSAPATAR